MLGPKLLNKQGVKKAVKVLLDTTISQRKIIAGKYGSMEIGHRNIMVICGFGGETNERCTIQTMVQIYKANRTHVEHHCTHLDCWVYRHSK